ncbi:MAG TPA: hypothetical protein VKU19_19630 [Bryobacteraceae bacterium]|nr:hypothetical protein [Bryobacteraceae bacterium]
MSWRQSSMNSDASLQLEPMLDLYWLAYLLTGDREQSIQSVVDTIDAEDSTTPFFGRWMTAWSRKIFIAKVLDQCRELPESPAGRGSEPIPATGKAALERALLSIGRFNRWALLLTVFEKLSVEDTAILLNASPKQVEAAKAIGLVELARNLALHQTVTVSAPSRHDSLPCLPVF